MSDSRDMLVDSATRLFRDLAEAGTKDFAAVWPGLVDMGFPAMMRPEDAGGIGADIGDAFAVLYAAARHGLSAPLTEAMIAQKMLAGMETRPGLATVAWRADAPVVDGRFTGTLRSVPWGREAAHVLLATGNHDYLLSTAGCELTAAESPAGEPRDTLSFANAAATPLAGSSAFLLGALFRTAQIAGALQAALDLAVGYANERVQFGRSIGKFQVVQHNLAMFAEETAAATAAGEAAARIACHGDAAFEIAAAKCRANKAAAFGQATAHAVFGAIGFTMEHPLNHLSRRLIGWRSEFGSQDYWAARLAEYALAMHGRGGFWAELTARSDKQAAAAR